MKHSHSSNGNGAVAAQRAMSLLVGTVLAGAGTSAQAANLETKADLFVRRAAAAAAPSAWTTVVVQLNGTLTAADLVLKPDIVAPGNRVISLEASTTCYLSSYAGNTNDIPLSVYRRPAIRNIPPTAISAFRAPPWHLPWLPARRPCCWTAIQA